MTWCTPEACGRERAAVPGACDERACAVSGSVQIPMWLDVTAVFVGAVQGAMMTLHPPSSRPPMAISGVVVIAIVMGMGGGIVRDLLLVRTPLALQSNWYLAAALVAVVVTWLVFRELRRARVLITTFDGLSLAMYTGLGAVAAEQAGLAQLGVILVGTLAGVGGSFVRDLLLTEIPGIMRPGEIYGIAAAAASITFVALEPTGLETWRRFLGATILGFLIRMLTVWRDWEVPAARPLMARDDDDIE